MIPCFYKVMVHLGREFHVPFEGSGSGKSKLNEERNTENLV